MNKKTIKMIVALLAILALSLVGIKVQAATATVTLQPSSNQVAVGTEFPVKVSVSNIDAGQGISRFEATVDYDEKIFNKIGPTSIEGMNGWQIQYDSSTKKLTAKNETFVKEDSDLMQITFKVKTKQEYQTGLSQTEASKPIQLNTVIGLKNINANNALSTFKINDVAQTIQVSENATQPKTNNLKTPTPTVPAANTNTNKPTQANTNTNKPAETTKTPTPVKTEEETRPTENPKAGLEYTPMILLIALFAVAITSYFGYKKFSEKA